MKINWFSVSVLLGVILSVTQMHIASADDTGRPTIAVIGTGDMGDSFGPRLGALGYPVVYGTRDPKSDKSQQLIRATGGAATATSPEQAAISANVIILAVPWPAMETVAQNLGSLKDKIVIDISMPSVQGDDGYHVPLLETSSAEMIQGWNPGARVVKAFATQGSFLIDDPHAVGGPATVPIAADDRGAKEFVARLAADMGLDPVDAGPLRMAREIEALQRLYMVPLLQRRQAAFEPYFRRSYYWACIWGDDWSKPVADAGNLADIPHTQGPVRPCPGP
ncbi:MAG: NADPH-dependent F420 reductase [Gammaproteobacteria bacterium]|nr:NADPH-dependent F420 reductase [Gammaproteobacteria bacterium]MDH4315776.1 NADPH-dependent F420 reductase [Gammaproteobacteria bacterium]MDH5215084.1 NADPH-dependent F420 reductase [Gammaproteobacteria bacterium]